MMFVNPLQLGRLGDMTPVFHVQILHLLGDFINVDNMSLFAHAYGLFGFLVGFIFGGESGGCGVG